MKNKKRGDARMRERGFKRISIYFDEAQLDFLKRVQPSNMRFSVWLRSFIMKNAEVLWSLRKRE